MYEIQPIEVPADGYAVYHNGIKKLELLNVGATLNFLSFDGRNLIDGYDTKTLQSFEWYKSAWLFPFPNRLRDGMYHFEGQSYAFPINETPNQNALHGFLYKEKFKLESQQSGSNSCSLVFSYSYDGAYSFYPFPFKVDIAYQLSHNELEVTFQVKNTGMKKLPFGMGWHPYFQMSEISQCQLQFPAGEQILLDDRQLPSGAFEPYKVFEESKSLHEVDLDNGFKMMSKSNTVLLQLENGAKLILDFENQQYLQVFTPEDRKRIAVEPMSSGIDVFNSHEGLTVLEPEAIKKFKNTLSWKAS